MSNEIKHYLPLDNQTAENKQIPSWIILVNSPIRNIGTINVDFPIENIRSMRLTRLSLTCRSRYLQQRSVNRISILIKEFADQAFITQEGRFHFIGRQDNIATGIDRPIFNPSSGPNQWTTTLGFYNFNHGVFNFHTPVNIVNQITLEFYDPINRLPLDKETINGYIVNNSNPATVVFSEEHGLYQDEFSIEQFTTGNPIADSLLISAVNTLHQYPAFNIIDDYTVTIPIDLSLMTPLPSNPVVLLYRKIQMIADLELQQLINE